MLFDKEYYYNYIINLERRSYLYFFIILILFTTLFFLIGYILNSNIIIFGLLGIIFGIIFGSLSINKDRIKIEEMKMHLDIYNKIFE